ncbi:DUF4190 domain-containing protein [Mycobacterium sp. CBMA226]|nr:DUF4190 domain-containing protein [Mycolicibacterium sp. CBMA 226]
MTHDGQPIYRVVGYTAEGTAVTADKVANSYNYSARTNGTAVASLILGLVCPPLAIPFGHIARQQILDTGERGDGLAIAGLVLGYVSIALCAIAVLVIAL